MSNSAFPFIYLLCHFVCELRTAEDVEVKMGHALAGIGTAVSYYAVARGQTRGFRDGGNSLEDVCHNTAVFIRYFVGT